MKSWVMYELLHIEIHHKVERKIDNTYYSLTLCCTYILSSSYKE